MNLPGSSCGNAARPPGSIAPGRYRQKKNDEADAGGNKVLSYHVTGIFIGLAKIIIVQNNSHLNGFAIYITFGTGIQKRIPDFSLNFNLT
jgi:hypothetical protein